MTETPISVEELLKKYNIQPHDLEYILNFMQKENISPQLAMRRIKLFEKLQEKMEQAQSDDKVKELTTELDHLSKVVEDLQSERDALQTEKADLDKEIEDTRLQQDLFNAEREELKLQMHALMDSIDTIESEAGEGGEQLQVENQDLKKKISMMTAGAQTLKERILKVGSETPNLRPLIQDIEKSLVAVIEAKQIPTDTAFPVSSDVAVVTSQPGTTPVKREIRAATDANETISPDQAKFVTPSPAAKTTEAVEADKKAPIVIATPPSTPVIKEKIFYEPKEKEELPVSEEPAVESKTEPKPESKPAPKPKPEPIEVPKKVVVDAKPKIDGTEVSAKIEKILRLFISYAGQADSDENWKARVAAICDMDEAYIELGGLAMSQIYSYQTQSLKKKKEFERLITSWIENGLPR